MKKKNAAEENVLKLIRNNKKFSVKKTWALTDKYANLFFFSSQKVLLVYL